MAPNTTLTLTTHNSNASKQSQLSAPHRYPQVLQLNKGGRVPRNLPCTWHQNLHQHLPSLTHPSCKSNTPWVNTISAQCLKTPPARAYAKRASPTWQNAGAGNIRDLHTPINLGDKLPTVAGFSPTRLFAATDIIKLLTFPCLKSSHVHISQCQKLWCRTGCPGSVWQSWGGLIFEQCSNFVDANSV